jgi:hypothetical protein
MQKLSAIKMIFFLSKLLYGCIEGAFLLRLQFFNISIIGQIRAIELFGFSIVLKSTLYLLLHLDAERIVVELHFH